MPSKQTSLCVLGMVVIVMAVAVMVPMHMRFGIMAVRVPMSLLVQHKQGCNHEDCGEQLT